MQSYSENAKVADREKQPELTELSLQFADLGQRLEKSMLQLTSIGNKLSDESGHPIPNELKKEPHQRPPGLISDLYRHVDGFSEIIRRIESQIRKIESQI